ncbi:MAG: sialate O-acetylesterase [Verrucomicrobiota bacterium]
MPIPVPSMRRIPGQPVWLLAVLLSFLSLQPLSAAVRLASPFTSHMVLQRDMKVPVWGTAAPGETVTVQFAGQKKITKADGAGNWRVDLDPLATSAKGRDFAVLGSIAKDSITLEDVVVGEVWLASGQSNMDFTVSKKRAWYAGTTNEEAEVAAANYPRIRMFSGELVMRDAPQRSVGGEWRVCSPETVPAFSAVAYFFARDLHQSLDVPVGIVCLAYGGSTAEAWVRREALAGEPKLKPMIERFDASNEVFKASVTNWEKYQQDRAAWEAGYAASRQVGERFKVSINKADPSQDNHNPTVLFNGMINPVIPYALRGVIWYQGESIVDGQAGRNLYPLVQSTLVRDWRQLWGMGDFPFYIVQLAGHGGISPDVRAAQETVLELPNTGMAVTVDIGNEKDIHPKNKQDVGNRLARIALAKTYRRDIEYSGPWLESMTAQDGSIRLNFSHAAGGLVIKGGPLKAVELAGVDKKFVAAEANVEGSSLVLSNAAVAKPVSARYAWSGYPDGGHIYNAAGLPAAPFNTDRLPQGIGHGVKHAP